MKKVITVLSIISLALVASAQTADCAKKCANKGCAATVAQQEQCKADAKGDANADVKKKGKKGSKKAKKGDATE